MPVTEAQVRNALKVVQDPDLHRDLDAINAKIDYYRRSVACGE